MSRVNGLLTSIMGTGVLQVPLRKENGSLLSRANRGIEVLLGQRKCRNLGFIYSKQVVSETRLSGRQLNRGLWKSVKGSERRLMLLGGDLSSWRFGTRIEVSVQIVVFQLLRKPVGA